VCHVERVARLARRAGIPLKPHQRAILAAHFSDDPETAAVLPKGNGKSALAGLVIVDHLLHVARPYVALVAGSREQAAPTYDYAAYIAQRAGDGRIVPRLRELRLVDGTGRLVILASDGKRSHGPTPSLAICEELWAHRSGAAYVSLRSAMPKRKGAKLLTISTPAANLDSPLGMIRQRALAGVVTRAGALTDARSLGLRYLEWGVDDDADDTDDAVVKAANPAPWITRRSLREARAALPRPMWLQFHCGRWGVTDGQWLPPGAWTACCAPGPLVEDGAEIIVGVDIGGSRASSAVVAVTPDLDVASVWIGNGDGAILQAVDEIVRLAARFMLREVAFDPWRFQGEALRLERDHGVRTVAFPQSHARMTVASEGLHAAIVERRLRHAGHHGLSTHVAAAVARKTGRGWRIDKLSDERNIDAAVALAIAVERAQVAPATVRLVGWL
jgi:phage terminase large subunit-like protein